MHQNKVNTILIILTLSIFTSCQKANIAKSGYFSKATPNRSIASVQAKGLDPKQVLIYCMATNANEKRCFDKNIKSRSTSSFYTVKKELNKMTNKYLASISNTINEKFEHRINFCNKNSLHNFKRCLSMNKDKNTMEILNKENKNDNFNAQEYVYLKKKIAMVLQDKISNYKLTGLTK